MAAMERLVHFFLEFSGFCTSSLEIESLAVLTTVRNCYNHKFSYSGSQASVTV